MLKKYFIIFLFLLLPSSLVIAKGLKNQEEWTHLPAGAKSAYMGIHGGTMPVSLLVSGDGTSLITFVGQTGNDFLDVLRSIYKPLFNFGNSSLAEVNLQGNIDLFAGNATTSLPVVALPADKLAVTRWLSNLQPFGLSSEPLSIEGEVTKPRYVAPVKKYQFSFLPDFFQPRR